MTCIVGIEHDGKVFMGGDSCGSTPSITIETKEPKVFWVNKDLLIGYTSSFRFGQLMQYYFKPPKQPKNMQDHEYLCTIFVDEMRKVFKEKGYLQIDKNVEEGGTALIAYKHKLYYLEDSFQILRAKEFASVGSGSYFAMGAMAALAGDTFFNRVLTALRVASNLNPYVKGPYYCGDSCAPFTIAKYG